MDVIPWALFAAAGSSALFFAAQWNGIKKIKAPAPNAPALEKKIDELKTELLWAKEETQRRQKLLEEVREEAKKRLRRDGKKNAEAQKGTGMDPRDVEMQGLKKGLASLESQLNQAKAELAQKTSELEQLHGDVRGASEGAALARDEARERSRTLAEENSNLKRTLEDLRSAMRKDTERPDVPGSSLDLRALPPDAVQELARYFRKGEEFERLYAVAQGQVQLSQDRYQELQRRYFAVCRELALAAGAKPGTDAEAKSAAESLVTGSDQLAAGMARNGRSDPMSPRTPGVPSAPGEGKKRRRRRRKRRLPGEATGVPSEALAGDEGDEGDEDGEEAPASAEKDGGDGSAAAADPAAEPAGDDDGAAPVGA